ncbi:MAG: hypothetical protein AB7V49_26725, partial [Mycolicibacterium sp.]
MAHPAPSPTPAPGAGSTDVDNPLVPYGTMRAQQVLFEQPQFGGPTTGYDEFVDAAGNVRPAWQELADCVRDRGRDGLDRLRAVVRGLVDNDGITYIQTDDGDAVPGPWHLDALPLVISAADW